MYILNRSAHDLSPSIISAIGSLSSKLKFPINSAQELEEKLAGKELILSGVTISVSHLKSAIPASYFPIVTKENFQEKARELVGSQQFRSAMINRLVEVRAPLSGALGRPKKGIVPPETR